MRIEDVYASLLKKIRDVQASGGGVSDYGDLANKPQINGVILNGNKASGELELIKYSTQEQLIGRWIDGRLLYEKTFEFGNLPNAEAKSLAHGISSPDAIWIYDGYVVDGGTVYMLDASRDFLNLPAGNSGYAWETSVSKSSITIRTSEDKSNATAYVTVRYTKSG